MKQASRSDLTPSELEGARARFLAKVKMVDEHWIWMGSLSSTGSCGWFRITPHFNAMIAHRASWLLWIGGFQAGKLIARGCAERVLCVRPGHLIAVTQLQFGRLHRDRTNHPRGERGGSAVLTEAEVRRAHALRGEGLAYFEIARLLHGTDRHDQAIRLALTGKSWRHLGLKPFPGRTYKARARRGRQRLDPGDAPR